jgi:hypothetical protein
LDTIPYSKDELREYFGQIAHYLINKQGGGAVTVEYTLEVSHEGNPLYIVEYPKLRILTEAREQDVTEVFDKSGIYELQAEFLPSEAHLRVEYPYLKTNNPETGIEVTGKTGQRFEAWFKQIMDALGGSIVLVPDTNFLRRHYYSNYFSKIVPKANGPPFKFALSRLTVIEIENKYNRSSTDARSKAAKLEDPSIKDEKKQDIELAEWEAMKEVRIAFHTAKEILKMRRKGADPLPHLNLDLLQSFSSQSGKGFADPWIRREILDVKNKVNERFVLLTSDMMNALVAVSENLSVIYLSRIDKEYFHADLVPLASLIINTAIHFGECDCKLTVGGDVKEFKIIGMWHGKSMNDWLNDWVLREGEKSSWLT